eukprot:1970993-Amphidinium_carterae.1
MMVFSAIFETIAGGRASQPPLAPLSQHDHTTLLLTPLHRAHYHFQDAFYNARNQDDSSLLTLSTIGDSSV